MAKGILLLMMGLLVQVTGVEAKDDGLIAGFRVGIQAYTYRGNTFEEAVQKTASLGLKYIEGYPGQRLSASTGEVVVSPDASPEVCSKVKSILSANGVQMVSFGVVALPGDEPVARKIFQSVKAMGVKLLVAKPEPNSFPMVASLSKEYGINVAIHNHATPHIYADPHYVQQVLKDADRRMGACPDTGHLMRSGFGPVESLKMFTGRVYGVHLKDLKEMGKIDTRDWPFGQGIADIPAILKELKAQKFDGVISIEYEASQPDPTADVKECIAYLRRLDKK